MSTIAAEPTTFTYNRVPSVTVDFWLIKLMAVTVGETAADFLGVNLGLGLTVTTMLMAVLLGVALLVQFRAEGYVPAIYWVAVVLISIVGTLITDSSRLPLTNEPLVLLASAAASVPGPPSLSPPRPAPSPFRR